MDNSDSRKKWWVIAPGLFLTFNSFMAYTEHTDNSWGQPMSRFMVLAFILAALVCLASIVTTLLGQYKIGGIIMIIAGVFNLPLGVIMILGGLRVKKVQASAPGGVMQPMPGAMAGPGTMPAQGTASSQPATPMQPVAPTQPTVPVQPAVPTQRLDSVDEQIAENLCRKATKQEAKGQLKEALALPERIRYPRLCRWRD
ncbi:hypothetical protein ACFLU6_11900 [Acidobacteriota bacterium]